MYKHHEEAIKNLIAYYEKQDEVIAVILGGSVAKQCERIDSDIDAMVIVTKNKYRELEAKNNLAECIEGYCDYEGGYFDIKYYTKEFIKNVSVNGSEPARNAYLGSRCLYTKDEEIIDIIASIPVFQIQEKEEKLLSFYSAFNLNYEYFWSNSKDNLYLKIRTAAEIVLYGYRIILQENHKLFPCHKRLTEAVEQVEKKPKDIITKAEEFLTKLDDETKEDFVNSILGFMEYVPPKDPSVTLTRFVDDNELWWCKDRPVITEW